jgi:hypothetical protein
VAFAAAALDFLYGEGVRRMGMEPEEQGGIGRHGRLDQS